VNPVFLFSLLIGFISPGKWPSDEAGDCLVKLVLPTMQSCMKHHGNHFWWQCAGEKTGAERIALGFHVSFHEGFPSNTHFKAHTW